MMTCDALQQPQQPSSLSEEYSPERVLEGDPSISQPLHGSQKKNDVKILRPIVEAFLQAKECESISSLLPSFTSISLPRKSSRLPAEEVVATYERLQAIALRVVKGLSKEGVGSFDGVPQTTIAEDPKLFLKLLSEASFHAIGSLLQGGEERKASSVERGILLKQVLSSGIACPLPTALLLSEKNLLCVPKEIEKCPSVKVLDLSKNELYALPPEIAKLSKLTYLNLSANKLRTLPSEMGQLQSLEILDLSSNPLECFPKWLRGIASLKALTLDKAQCAKFSQEIKSFSKKKKNCQIEERT